MNTRFAIIIAVLAVATILQGCASKPVSYFPSDETTAVNYGRYWDGKHFTDFYGKYNGIDVARYRLEGGRSVHIWHKYYPEDNPIPRGLIRVLYRNNYWVFFTVISGDTLIFDSVEQAKGARRQDEEAPLLSPLDSEKWEDDRMIDIQLSP